MGRTSLHDLFPVERPLLGVVHLPPLPGAPAGGGEMAAVRRRAVRDARVLAEGGMDGVLVENYGDAPFHPASVPPETVAAMSVAAADVADAVDVPVGVNVLRNDGEAALSAATAAGASFVRVNVWTGARVSDQGVVQGVAHRVLRLRRRLAARVAVLADVAVKHSAPLADRPVREEAADAVERGRADGLLVTGPATGRPPEIERVREVRRAAGATPVLVASGVAPSNAAELLAVADGAIVGSCLKEDGETPAPVEPGRVEELVRAVRG